jgi:hypothetical protein
VEIKDVVAVPMLSTARVVSRLIAFSLSKESMMVRDASLLLPAPPTLLLRLTRVRPLLLLPIAATASIDLFAPELAVKLAPSLLLLTVFALELTFSTSLLVLPNVAMFLIADVTMPPESSISP